MGISWERKVLIASIPPVPTTYTSKCGSVYFCLILIYKLHIAGIILWPHSSSSDCINFLFWFALQSNDKIKPAYTTWRCQICGTHQLNLKDKTGSHQHTGWLLFCSSHVWSDIFVFLIIMTYLKRVETSTAELCKPDGNSMLISWSVTDEQSFLFESFFSKSRFQS